MRYILPLLLFLAPAVSNAQFSIQNVPTHSGPAGMYFAHFTLDLNGDQLPDLARFNRIEKRLEILPGQSTAPYFGDPVFFSIPHLDEMSTGAYSPFQALDSDKRPDLVLLWGKDSLLAFRNMGQFSFQHIPDFLASLNDDVLSQYVNPSDSTMDLASISFQDINRDGRLDWFGAFVPDDTPGADFEPIHKVSLSSGPSNRIHASGSGNPISRQVFVNLNGQNRYACEDLEFTLSDTFSLKELKFPSYNNLPTGTLLKLAHWVGDSLPDALVVYGALPDLRYYVLWENQNGQWVHPVLLPISDYFALDAIFKTLDLNGDGRQDILYVNAISSCVRFYLQNENGQFTDAQFQACISAEFLPRYQNAVLDAHDWTGDGRDDVLVLQGAPFRYLLFSSDSTANGNLVNIQAFADFDYDCDLGWVGAAPDPFMLQTLPDSAVYMVQSGQANLSLPAGTYSLRIPAGQIPAGVDTICGLEPDLVVGPQTGSQTRNLGFQGKACSYLTMEMDSRPIRSCELHGLTLSIRNQGLAMGNGEIQISLPTSLGFVSLTKSVSSPGQLVQLSTSNQLIRYRISNLPPFSKVRLALITTVSCDPQVAGDIACVEAHLIRLDSCLLPRPAFDGADLEVRYLGCQPDGSQQYRIRNHGSAMTAPAEAELFEKGKVTQRFPFVLGKGDSLDRSFVPTATLTSLRVPQRSQYPGDAYASAVSSCRKAAGVPGLLEFNQNQLLDFPNNRARVCEVIRAAYDPNDKSVYPHGWGDEGNVPPGTRLHYTIRFQNTGTAPASVVELRDTLAALLDLASLRVEASSHSQYRLNLEPLGQQTIFTITYSGIMLPDSLSDPVKSQGFFRFSIQPKAGVPSGTEVRNRAGIYFDLNPVVLTNFTRSRFYVPENESIPSDMDQWLLYPNPNTDGEIHLLKTGNASVSIRVFDLPGRLLWEGGLSENQFSFRPSVLRPGFYHVELRSAGHAVTRKLIVR